MTRLKFWNRDRDDPDTLTKRESTLSRLLDDITVLEVNTIIKEGSMTMSPPHDQIEDILQGIFIKYKQRLALIQNKYSLGNSFGVLDSSSVKDFHERVKSMMEFLNGKNDRPEITLENVDY